MQLDSSSNAFSSRQRRRQNHQLFRMAPCPPWPERYRMDGQAPGQWQRRPCRCAPPRSRTPAAGAQTQLSICRGCVSTSARRAQAAAGMMHTSASQDARRLQPLPASACARTFASKESRLPSMLRAARCKGRCTFAKSSALSGAIPWAATKAACRSPSIVLHPGLRCMPCTAFVAWRQPLSQQRCLPGDYTNGAGMAAQAGAVAQRFRA